MTVSLYQAVRALDDSLNNYVSAHRDPSTYNLCIALKGIAQALERIERDVVKIKRG